MCFFYRVCGHFRTSHFRSHLDDFPAVSVPVPFLDTRYVWFVCNFFFFIYFYMFFSSLFLFHYLFVSLIFSFTNGYFTSSTFSAVYMRTSIRRHHSVFFFFWCVCRVCVVIVALFYLCRLLSTQNPENCMPYIDGYLEEKCATRAKTNKWTNGFEAEEQELLKLRVCAHWFWPLLNECVSICTKKETK